MGKFDSAVCSAFEAKQMDIPTLAAMLIKIDLSTQVAYCISKVSYCEGVTISF